MIGSEKYFNGHKKASFHLAIAPYKSRHNPAIYGFKKWDSTGIVGAVKAPWKERPAIFEGGDEQ